MGKWVKKKLGEDNLFDFIKGEQINGEKLSDKGLYPMYNGGIDPSGYLDVYNTKAPQIIMSEGGNSCGYVNYIIDDFWRGGHCYLVKVNHENLFDKLFLFHLLKFHEDSIMKLRVGSGLPNIQKKDLYKFPISYPSSLSEQRRIASILSSADKVIDSTQKLIAKYKSIKQGMMEDLLKPKEGWKKVKLGEVGKISMCKRVFSFETSIEGEIPFYKIGTFGKTADAFITRQLFEEYKNKFSYPKVGDILISASGTIGRTVVYDGEPAYFQDSNIIWIDNDETIVLNQFLYYQYKIISWNLEGSTIARLYNDNFNKIEIFVPDFSEQRRIASILSSIDKKIESEEKTLEKYKNIKKGLMEKLLKENDK